MVLSNAFNKCRRIIQNEITPELCKSILDKQYGPEEWREMDAYELGETVVESFMDENDLLYTYVANSKIEEQI